MEKLNASMQLALVRNKGRSSVFLIARGNPKSGLMPVPENSPKILELLDEEAEEAPYLDVGAKVSSPELESEMKDFNVIME
jgi:hypothetical protein